MLLYIFSKTKMISFSLGFASQLFFGDFRRSTCEYICYMFRNI